MKEENWVHVLTCPLDRQNKFLVSVRTLLYIPYSVRFTQFFHGIHDDHRSIRNTPEGSRSSLNHDWSIILILRFQELIHPPVCLPGLITVMLKSGLSLFKKYVKANPDRPEPITPTVALAGSLTKGSNILPFLYFFLLLTFFLGK